MTIRPTKKITPHQAAIANAYIKCGNITDAGMETGHYSSRESAASSASEILRRPEVQNALQSEMNKLGFGAAAIAKKLQASSDAEKAIAIPKDARLVNVPDNPVRLAALRLAAEAHGFVKTGNTFEDNRYVSITMTADAMDKALDRIESIEQGRRTEGKTLDCKPKG
jgi:phage terminase small subunit